MRTDDSDRTDATDRFAPATRRRVLASLGAGGALLLGGCAGADGGPTYEDGEVNDTDGEPRSAGEMSAAAAVAQQDATESATSLQELRLEKHAFVLQDGYKGPTVEGTVANAGDTRVELAEVRVRAYGSDGAVLGRYLTSTGDLPPNTTWKFEVILLASVDAIADYDIAVVGLPS